MKTLFKFFSILLMVLMTVGMAEAAKGKGKAKKAKANANAMMSSKNTCPTGLDGKLLKDAFPYYSHEAFEKAADPKFLDPVSGPVMNPFSKNLKLGRGVYNVYAIDGDKTGIPSMDDLEPLVDMQKLQDYKIQELAVPGHCFLYVEEKIEATPAKGDKDQAKDDDAQQHKSVLLLVKNKSHANVATALTALQKASKSTKGGGDDASPAAKGDDAEKDDDDDADAKKDDDDDADAKKDAGSSDEKVFGSLRKGGAAAVKSDDDKADASEEEGDDSGDDAKGDDASKEDAGDDKTDDDSKDDDDAGGDDSGGDDKGDDEE